MIESKHQRLMINLSPLFYLFLISFLASLLTFNQNYGPFASR